jgi:hypothetical protein
MSQGDRFRLTDEEDEQLAYERAEIVSKIMNDDLAYFSFGMRGNCLDNVSKPEVKPKPKRFRLKSKSKIRQRQQRPQIHYHRLRVRMRARTKKRPIRGFRQ